ncbi:hypothetical protein COCSADRAFT_352521 [Bipolaris sorokiniana ND90Pr]|uniref:Uncharacterized protein n=1 Tax=Cochliobolus sativus (strain ND90Pr / ATCC 201652) TaxID=665912 RepID=M2SK33_COCSN|nr:uncharacterized protein COCSADRAFT_352521 [Bipolaris sorokiniana ND90Pr]EMD67538.1 hypothetical protein COCSADRAFT_352521 [Bipolaris sorokiniana ND90Pr]
MAEPADTECLSTKALRQIHSLMGEDALFLEHLPIDKIRGAEFEDKKQKRLTSLPQRILFGQITEGEKKGLEVWILPIKTRDENQWPGHRFNLFDRHGNLHSGITIEEAIRLTNAANAFKWLKKYGTMDSTLLRAVIRYYFMVKKVKPPSPWPVDKRFTAELLAACKVAAGISAKEARAKQKTQEREAGTALAYKRRPSPAPKQAARTMTSVDGLRAETTATSANGQKANTIKTPTSMPTGPKLNPTLPVSKAQSAPRYPVLQPSSTQPFPPSSPEDETSLFIPERRRHAATSEAFQTPTPVPHTSSAFIGQPRIEPIDEFKRAFQRKMLPKPAPMLAPTLTPIPTPSISTPSSHTMSIQQEINKPDSEKPDAPVVPAALAPATPAPVPPIATTSTILINPNIPLPLPFQPPTTPPTTKSSSSFIPAYRETLTKHSQLTALLRTTRSSLHTTRSQVQELEAKEKMLKEEIKRVEVEKKRLHDSLTPEKREVFLFGREI